MASKRSSLLSSMNPSSKKKLRPRISWDKISPSKDSFAEQIDAFVADVIAKASQDYLEECKNQNKTQDDYWAYADEDVLTEREENQLSQLSTRLGYSKIRGSEEEIDHTLASDERRRTARYDYGRLEPSAQNQHQSP